MLFSYSPGDRVWLRMGVGEVVVTVLDREQNERGRATYVVRASDGSQFEATDEMLRQTTEEPLVLPDE